MLEAAFFHADIYETRLDGERFAPCWLSELDDKREYIGRTDPDTVYDSLYTIIIEPENGFFEMLSGSERFERLMEKLKEKIGK